MSVLARNSIRTKLNLLTCVVAGTAVALAGLGFAGLGFLQLCASQAQQLENHAQLIGYYSGPIVADRNRAEGDRLLASLSRDPSIEGACLFDAEQNCIARFGSAKTMTFPFHLQGKSYRLASLGRLETLSQIDAPDQSVGFIYLRANTNVVQAKVGQLARGGGIIFLVVIGVCWVVAVPFRRAISMPILHLAESIGNVSASDQPSININEQSSPEGVQILNAVSHLIARINALAVVSQPASPEPGSRAEKTQGLAQAPQRLHPRPQKTEPAKIPAAPAGVAGRVVTGMELAQNDASTAHIDRLSCWPQIVIAETVARYQGRADAKGLAFEYQWRGNDGEPIDCDPERLRQVVGVLAENAIRFTEAGGIRIDARLEQAPDSRRLCIEVTDTGAGIDADALDQIFNAPEPSGLSEQSKRVAPDEGTSLGLHQCRRIVSELGGQISVASSVGEGTLVTVTINARVVSSSNDTTPGQSSVPDTSTARAQPLVAPGDPPGEQRTQAPRILVVDDSDCNRNVTGLILRRAGARVESVENGLEAVQAAIRETYDLIFMDMQMPVMDGYSATREIRAQGIDVPIIALTAYALDFDEQKCRAAGCIGHLVKPIEAETLLAAAERVLPPARALTRTTEPAVSLAPARPAEAKPVSPYAID